MATKRSRSYFFTTVGDSRIGGFWRRFVGGGVSKPTQATMEDLLESTAFHTETSSAAQVDSVAALGSKQGLVIISTDANAKSGDNTVGGSSGGSVVVQPSHLPTVNSSAQTIDTNLALTDFNDSVFTTTPDATSTRNNYIINFKSTFITWLQSAFNELVTSIGGISSSLSTLSSTVSSNTTSIATNASNISTISGKVLPTGGTANQILSKIDSTNYNTQWVDNTGSGDTYKTTSSSSVTVANGTTKNFTVPSGLAIGVNTRMRAYSLGTPTNFMEGLCSYSGTTILMSVDTIGGSGTISDWIINLAGIDPEVYTTASTSSVEISFATATKTFTVSSGLSYKIGMRVRCSSIVTPSDFIEGIVTSYTGTTLVIKPDCMGGSGYGSTVNQWNIYLGGAYPLTTNLGSSVVPTFTGGVAPTLGVCTVQFTRVVGMVHMWFQISYSSGSGSYSAITMPMPVGMRPFIANCFGVAYIASNNGLVLTVTTSGNNIVVGVPSGGASIPSGSQIINGSIMYPYE